MNAELNGPTPPRAFVDIGARVIDSTPHAMARSYAPARHHTLGDEVRRLLRRAALAVDGGGGDVPRQPGGDPGVACDVAALLPRLGHTTADDVVDGPGIDVIAFEEGPQRQPEQVGRVPVRQRTLPLADRGAHRVDDHRLTCLHCAPSLEPTEPDMVVRSC